MSINDWFKQREGRRYTVSAPGCPEGASDGVPDGVWRSCPQCKRTLYQGDVARCLSVCPHCGHHFELIARDRIEALIDPGSFDEVDAGLTPVDPLRFAAGKPYAASLERACATTGMTDATLTGRATIGGHPVVIGAMDFRFVGASMGSVVGERIARAFDRARDERRGVVLLVASGGARMQEGMLSLMQMAKTSAALNRFRAVRKPYISVMLHPTTGGVAASFAWLGDVVIAEPKALIGFAGPRVIEQTIREKLPPGFQRSEFLLEHGMIDAIVPRLEMKARLDQLLGLLG